MGSKRFIIQGGRTHQVMRLKPKAMLDSFPRQLKQTAITDNSPIRLSEQSGLTVYIRNRDHLAESFRLTSLHRDKSAVLTFLSSRLYLFTGDKRNSVSLYRMGSNHRIIFMNRFLIKYRGH